MAEPDDRLAALRSLAEVDAAVRAAAIAELDRKTKPRRSLGRLEELAAQIAAIRGDVRPEPLRTAIVVAAADHGVVAEGVSAYPQEVTRQMVANFASGGAAICVLARAAGAQLVVIDVGIVTPFEHQSVRSVRIGPGTANAVDGPAMTREQAVASILAGASLAGELAAEGFTAIALGEMGIGNTTAASAVACALLGGRPHALCGPGTGLDAAGVARKAAVVEAMLARNAPDPDDPVAVLSAVGGFELGFLAGVALEAAANRCAVILDGFITGAAALVADRLAPALRGYLIASHRSAEPGHRIVLDALEVAPLLELELRLGEGSGAALALPLLAAARDVLVEMATFADAGVTDTGR